MSIACVVNLILGLMIAGLGVLVCTEHSTGEAFHKWILKHGQSAFGEYWNVHHLIVGIALVLAGCFFLAVAFSIFGAAHNFWVLSWF